jgi:hypothetical protein
MAYIADTFNAPEPKEETQVEQEVVFAGVEPAETCCNEDCGCYSPQVYNALMEENFPDMSWTQNRDAMVWAEKFMEITSTSSVAVDLMTMVGWFANAIENGAMHGYKDGWSQGREALIDDLMYDLEEDPEWDMIPF